MKIKRSSIGKVLLVLIALVVAGGGVYFHYRNDVCYGSNLYYSPKVLEDMGGIKVIPPTIRTVFGEDWDFFNRLGLKIEAMVLLDCYKIENLTHLKFDFPTSSSSGLKQTNEYFDLKNPYRMELYEGKYLVNAENRKKLLTEDSKIIFLWRRDTSPIKKWPSGWPYPEGSTLDTLYAVITNLKPGVCESSISADVEKVHIKGPLNLTPSGNGKIIREEASYPIYAEFCVYSQAENAWFYFNHIVAKAKKPGHANWEF